MFGARPPNIRGPKTDGNLNTKQNKKLDKESTVLKQLH